MGNCGQPQFPLPHDPISRVNLKLDHVEETPGGITHSKHRLGRCRASDIFLQSGFSNLLIQQNSPQVLEQTRQMALYKFLTHSLVIPILSASVVLLSLAGCDLFAPSANEIRGYTSQQIKATKIPFEYAGKGYLLAQGGSAPTIIWLGKNSEDKTVARFATLKENDWKLSPIDLPMGPGARLAAAATDSKGRLHFLWLERKGHESIRRGFLTMFSDGKWSTPVQLSNNAASVFFATMAIGKDDAVHIAWSAAIGHNSAILLRTIRNGVGGEIQQLALPSNQSTFWQPTMEVAPDGRLHLAYVRMEAKNTVVVHQTGDEEGKSWSTVTEIPGQPSHSNRPELAVGKAGQVKLFFLAGKKGEKLYTADQVDGKWQDAKLLSDRPGAPVMIVAGSDESGRIHAAWVETSWDRKQSAPKLMAINGKHSSEVLSLPVQAGKGYGVQTWIGGEQFCMAWVVEQTEGKKTLFWNQLSLKSKGK